MSEHVFPEELEMIPNKLSEDVKNAKQKKMPKKIELKIKYCATFVIYFCAFVYGITIYIYASSILDLKVIMKTTIEKMTLVIPIVSISYTTGSILSGFLFNTFDRHLCSIALVIMMGLSVALTPHSPNMYFLYTAAVIKGFSSGAFNNAQFVWIIDVWREKSGPFLHALQFCVSIGSFITPLMNKPFLISCPLTRDNHFNYSQNLSQNYSILLLNRNNTNSSIEYNSLSMNNELIKNPDMSEIIFENRYESLPKELQTCNMHSMIQIPYAFQGLLGCCGAMLLIILFKFLKQKQNIENSNKAEESFKNNEEQYSMRKTWIKGFFILTGFILLGSFFGIEISSFQFMATFSRYINKQILGPESALLMAVFGGAFTVFRGLSVLISIKLKPQMMLCFNFLIILIANILFIKFGSTSRPMIITACVLLGIGFSSTLPSLYSFLEQYIHVNNTIGSLFSFSGGLMAAIYTLLIGKLIDRIPLLLIYINLCSISITIFTFILIYFSKYFLKDDKTSSKLNDCSQMSVF